MNYNCDPGTWSVIDCYAYHNVYERTINLPLKKSSLFFDDTRYIGDELSADTFSVPLTGIEFYYKAWPRHEQFGRSHVIYYLRKIAFRLYYEDIFDGDHLFDEEDIDDEEETFEDRINQHPVIAILHYFCYCFWLMLPLASALTLFILDTVDLEYWLEVDLEDWLEVDEPLTNL